MTRRHGNGNARDRLLDAAAKIFRERGYVATTMRAIAREAGIEAASIYYHYRSKDELISAVLDFGMTALLKTVAYATEEMAAETPPRERIERAIHAHVSAILQYGDYMLAMRRVFGQVPARIWKRHMILREQYGALWHDLLEGARAEGVLRADVDITIARLFLLGGLNWTVEWLKPQKQPVSDVAHTFASLVLDGMLAPAPQPTVSKAPARARARSNGRSRAVR